MAVGCSVETEVYQKPMDCSLGVDPVGIPQGPWRPTHLELEVSSCRSHVTVVYSNLPRPIGASSLHVKLACTYSSGKVPPGDLW
jgi:hypothetical protein